MLRRVGICKLDELSIAQNIQVRGNGAQPDDLAGVEQLESRNVNS